MMMIARILILLTKNKNKMQYYSVMNKDINLIGWKSLQAIKKTLLSVYTTMFLKKLIFLFLNL